MTKPDEIYMRLITPHQQRMLRLWLTNGDTKKTGETLRMTQHCVQVHLGRIRETMGVTNDAQLVLLMYGLLDGDELGLQYDVRARCPA